MSAAANAQRAPVRAWWRPGIGMRLLVAQTTVLLAGALTTWMVAAIVGPPLFRDHLRQAGVAAHSAEQHHAEEAYQYAMVAAVGGALAVSVLAAFAVSWYISRRLQRSVTEVASAATAVADGRYTVRVAPPHLGQDFDALAAAFNQMAGRLQAVDATRRHLFADLAHEIRTPVAVLEAYMEAVEDGVESLTPTTVAMLRDQTRRLVRFAQDAAALAQAEESSASMTTTDTDIAELVTTAVSAAAKRYRAKQVTLSTHLPPRVPTVSGDPQRLAQVLANLLDNALRHTPPRGHVDVRVHIDRHQLEVSISDTGEGIPAQHLPYVFERFYRVEPERAHDNSGAGIGLAIAKALVEAHGGSITARSQGPGTGATFIITFPVATSEHRRPDLPRPASQDLHVRP